MAQDIEPKVTWKHTLGMAWLMCLAFLGIDWIHFFLVGTKFTYLMNPLSPTAASDFLFYLLSFVGMGFLMGLLVNFETKDVVAATQIGPLFFLAVNGVILHILIIQNPAYAAFIIPNFNYVYGSVNLYEFLPMILLDFWIIYAHGILLFELICIPFLLTSSFTGHLIRVMLGWNWPA